MLHAQTVVYDTNFETPKEEYDYELARVENYEELVPLAIEQKQPSENTLAMIDDFVKKAAQIKSEGQAIAAKGTTRWLSWRWSGNLQPSAGVALAGVNYPVP